MTTADWALIISLCSAVVSFAGFVWNVWSKFIYPKPHVRVTCGMKFLVEANVKQEDQEDFIDISAVNHGPIAVTITGALLEEIKWEKFRRRRAYGLLNPLHGFPYERELTVGPFGGGLPKTLQVGERFSLYFVPNHSAFADNKWKAVMLADTFGNYHRARKHDLLETRAYAKEAIARLGQAPS